nr:hypothetical protein [uncultured Methanoregula sp.]
MKLINPVGKYVLQGFPKPEFPPVKTARIINGEIARVKKIPLIVSSMDHIPGRTEFYYINITRNNDNLPSIMG